MNAIATVAPADNDPRSLALLKAVGLDRLSPEQRELALNIASRYELDLLLKHLVMIDGRPYITRDGLLHIAHRSGQLDGIEVTEPTVVEDFWRSTCSVYRKDMSRPFTYTGRYPVKGKNAVFAPEMAVKVGEVMALRRAFDVSAPTLEERWDVEPEALPPAEPAGKPTLAEKARAAAEAVSVEPDATEDTSAVAAEPTGLTREAFFDRLDTLAIPQATALAKTRELFPELRRGQLLSDVQRGALMAALEEDELKARQLAAAP